VAPLFAPLLSVLAVVRRGLANVFDLPRQVLMGLVRLYRLLLKPWLGSACRFEPTCSAYTLQALQQHGACAGALLGGWRLLRCQPWCQGGHDPVPASISVRLPGLFTRLGLKNTCAPSNSVESPPAPVSSRNPP
jgi:uncharacterized protein